MTATAGVIRTSVNNPAGAPDAVAAAVATNARSIWLPTRFLCSVPDISGDSVTVSTSAGGPDFPRSLNRVAACQGRPLIRSARDDVVCGRA